MVFYCLVRYCKSTALRSTKELTFHRIPVDWKRRREWLEACNRTDLINKGREFFKRKHVCSKHFEKFMYGKRCLQKFASPTLHLTPTLQDSWTQCKFVDPTPSISELPSLPNLKYFGLKKSQTETEKFMSYADHNLENDNPTTHIDMQSDELELKDEKELEINETLQIFTDSDHESEEDTSEISVDEFLRQSNGLEEEIRKELKNQNIPQIPICKSKDRSNPFFEINKETQTDDVAVFDIPKNNICFQQCLRCGKNASWLALKSKRPKKFKPAHLITLEDFKKACEKYLSPSFCAIVKNQIQLEQMQEKTAIKTPEHDINK